MGIRVLVTGASGFVGANCVEYWLANTDWELVCLNSYRHRGNCQRVIRSTGDSDRVKVLRHDLTAPIDRNLASLIGSVDLVINLASESAVERSCGDPIYTVENNVSLMLHVLEFAKQVQPRLFMQLSTDEVYGECLTDAHREWDTILPSNPYAASKAAQEAICIAYWRTYRMPIVLVNCMNMIGLYQDTEKMVPKVIRKVFCGEEMPIYGKDGEIGSRSYIDCHNLADAFVWLSRREPAIYPASRVPDRWNVAGEEELNNLELAQTVAMMMGKELKYRLIPSESARPGYDKRYALDGSKLRKAGWKPPMTTEQSLQRIVQFTLANTEWLE